MSWTNNLLTTTVETRPDPAATMSQSITRNLLQLMTECLTLCSIRVCFSGDIAHTIRYDTIEEFHVISLRCYRSAVWLFLCLSRSEGIDTISFAYNSPMCLPAVCVKICQPPSSSPTFAAKWFKPCPVGMSVGVIRRANCGRMVRDSAMVTMDNQLGTTIALSNGTIWHPLPKMGIPNPAQNSQRALPPGECDGRYRQAMSPFAKWLLFQTVTM